MAFSTYLGGSSSDEGTGIAIDGEGNAYLTGWTMSRDFPVVNGFQSALGAGPYWETDSFVTKLDASGALLSYSS
jgi:hypothetical protein